MIRWILTFDVLSVLSDSQPQLEASHSDPTEQKSDLLLRSRGILRARRTQILSLRDIHSRIHRYRAPRNTHCRRRCWQEYDIPTSC